MKQECGIPPITGNTQEEGINPRVEILEQSAHLFLGEEYSFIDTENIGETIKEVSLQEQPLKQNYSETNKNIAIYDKYSKSFNLGEEKGVSVGNIISSRRWGFDVCLPENLENFGDGKKVRKLMLDSKLNDLLYQKLNKQLAISLSEKTQRVDALTSQAYLKIAERSGIESRQTGVFAEQIIIGVLEGLSIDHPDLGFSVTESNAYQDVTDKIDFIISTKQKKRGVGVNREEEGDKSIGIQLTTNFGAREHKNDQIAKAKARGVEVDDIVYIEIKKETLEEAIRKWENSGKKIAGPWEHLSPEIKTKTITNLLHGVLNEEQEKSLQKIIVHK